MQINQIARPSWARFDIAKLFLVVVAAAALLLAFTVAAPASHQAASTPAARKAAQPKTAVQPSTAQKAHTVKPAVAQSPRAAGAPPGSVEPPAQIASNCSHDVSSALQKWLASLPAGSVVYSPASACYLINQGIDLLFPYELTIDGGTFTERTSGGPHRAAFDLIGGSKVTFENLEIVGPNVKVQWVPTRAFQSGIDLQGTADATIFHVRIQDVYGDGITLAPLRGSSDHASGVILRPVENVTIEHVYIDGAGRQGITPGSVNGGMFSDITFHDIHWNAFDFETDQGNEGAENVTINGCSVVTAQSLANFSGNAAFMGPVTIENCNMRTIDGGTAVYVKSTTGQKNHGPLTLKNDVLRCPARAPVPCLQLTDAQDFVVSNTTIAFGLDSAGATEPVYGATERTNASFVNDTVTGYGRVGWVDHTSNVSVTAGTWSTTPS